METIDDMDIWSRPRTGVMIIDIYIYMWSLYLQTYRHIFMIGSLKSSNVYNHYNMSWKMCEELSYFVLERWRIVCDFHLSVVNKFKTILY